MNMIKCALQFRENQINIAEISILKLLFTNKIIPIQIQCRVENQQTQSTYDTGCGNRTHWWKENALTTSRSGAEIE